MLGSHAEAEDVVQEAWIRLSRTDADEVSSLPEWLTTMVSRICLNVLRSCAAHPEDPVGLRLPDPVISPEHSCGHSPGPEDASEPPRRISEARARA